MVLLLGIGFFIGSALGSFLAVLVDRTGRNEQILSGRSKCDKCKKPIAPYDLIPLVSYIILRGKCRYCKAKIPFHLFVFEVIAGILGLALAYYSILQTGLGLISLISLFVVFYSLLGIFLTDFYHGLIPDELIAAIIVASFFLIFLTLPSLLFVHLITGFACLSLFLSLFLITRGRGMGFGDVKFSFALGFFLGFPSAVIALYFAFVSAAVVSVGLIILGKKKLHGGIIVFGPFLTLGTVFGYFWGNRIVGLFF